MQFDGEALSVERELVSTWQSSSLRFAASSHEALPLGLCDPVADLVLLFVNEVAFTVR